ncbi:MAG: DUF3613 domain-containing protein [Methylococcales bacterium]
MNQTVFWIVLLFELLSVSTVGAAELPTESNGEAIRRWLELQRSGAVASPVRQTLSGSVADHIHERYLNSFNYPIPESYYKDKNGRGAPSSSQ